MNSRKVLTMIATEGLFVAAMGVCGTLDIARIGLIGVAKGAGAAKKLAAKTEAMADSGAENVRSMEIRVLEVANGMVDSMQKWGDKYESPVTCDAMSAGEV